MKKIFTFFSVIFFIGLGAVALADNGSPSDSITASYNVNTHLLSVSGTYSGAPVKDNKQPGYAIFINGNTPGTVSLDSLVNILPKTESGNFSNSYNLDSTPDNVCVVIYDLDVTDGVAEKTTGDHSVKPAGSDHNEDNSWDKEIKHIKAKGAYAENDCTKPTGEDDGGDDEDQNGTLIVKKVIVGNDSVNYGAFSFVIDDGSPVYFDNADGVNEVSLLEGQHTVVENPVPENYVVSYSNCTNVSVNSEDEEGDKKNDSLSKDDEGDVTPVCIITNTYVTHSDNSCPAPDSSGDNTKEEVNVGSEKSLQHILSDAGYSVNVDTDQKQYQLWHVDANSEVVINSKFIDGISAQTAVFGYYTDSAMSNFVPVFKTTNIAGYESVPMFNTGPFTINTGAADTIGFAIKYFSGNTYVGVSATENSQSTGGGDMAVVYNPSNDKYVIAFEDWVNGDYDYNDLVVEVALGCEDLEQEHTATVTLCKFDESQNPLSGWTLKLNDGLPGDEGDYSGVTGENGCVIFEKVPYSNREVAEVMKAGWENVSGLDEVVVNDPTETFNVVNKLINVNENESPTANAGADQLITLPTNSVNLDGSGSTDSDGTISSYVWTEVSGPSVVDPADTVTPNVNGLIAGTYVFKLTVTDNDGATDDDTVTITVNPEVHENVAPTANAGADQLITLPTNSVNLDGSGSTDSDGTISSYVWTEVSGPSVVDPADTVTPNVNGLIAGTYVFKLTVTDNDGATDDDTVTITVNPEVVPPPACSDDKDNDEDGLVDANDPGCHSDGDVNNTNSYVPTDNDESNTTAECGDGKDNSDSEDTLVDSQDPGCHTDGNANNINSYDKNDASEVDVVVEHPACSDGVDNDGDHKVDAADPGCHSDGNANNGESYTPNDNDETDVVLPECSDGIDNDHDGKIDYPTDKGCKNAQDNNERNPSSGGGGGSVAPKGEVLGATTACGIYVEKYLRKGYPNDKNSVIKVQTFLNNYMNAGLVIDGIYGSKTEAAVNNFQLAHKDKILTPWGINHPTGIFYLTTQTEVNNIMCPPLNLPIPSNLVNFHAGVI